MAAPRSRSWLKLFEAFVDDVRIASKESASTDERGDKLVMWESQRRVLHEIGTGLDRDVHKFNILKAAQLGITTITLTIDAFWFAVHPNLIGCLVTDDEHKRDANRDFLTKQIESFPPGYFGEKFTIVKNNRTALHFSNGSRLDLLVAGTKKKSLSWSEGIGYGYAHLCMAPGTPVLTDNGTIRPIEDVQVGDVVMTHNGNFTTVIDKLGQLNDKGPMIRITPWCGSGMLCSKEHKWPTRRGLVRADQLMISDELVMPVRPIRKRVTHDFLPATENIGNGLPGGSYGWIRKLGAGSGLRIEIDEELGFAMGYYLAEGCISWTYPTKVGGRMRPSGIKFTRHRDEVAYGDRAAAALLPYTTGKRAVRDRPGCLTTEDWVYGVAISLWIDSYFGHSSGKHIPDCVFDWGRDFCRGMLTGYLCGDGDKREANRVGCTTIHSSIAMQMRDIAASLGYGWASCRNKPAGDRYGRNCKEAWLLYWGGDGGRGLRELLGLPNDPVSRKGPIETHSVEGDKVFIKLRDIEWGIEVPFMWDLSVEHEDHTFRTPYGCTSNTEIAKYGDPRGLKSLEERFAQTNPHRLYIYESTADGFNHWRTKWLRGLEDPSECSMFIGWWSGDTNKIERRDPRFKVYGLYPESAEERDYIVQVAQQYNHRVTPEQLAWYRWKQSGAGAEQGLLDQNEPWTAEQAFVQTGYSFFQSRVLGGDIKALSDDGPEYQGYRYEVSNDFFGFRMHHLDPRQGDKEEDVELKIYEEPVEGAQYVIGCDPAYGRNEHKDHHCASVWRCFADKIIQVAEFVTADVETKHFAWVIFHMCAAYRNSMCNVELGGPGRLIMAEFDHLRQLLGAEMNAGRVEARGWQDAAANARWYLYHKVDSPGAGYMHNFETNWRTKDELMHGYRGVYSSREIVIRSVNLLYEMNNVVVVDGNIGAPESTDENMKDDRVFAAALATRAWADWVRKQQITEGLTYDVVMQAEQAEKLTPYQSKVGSIVANFLRSAEEQANEEPEPPAWLQNQGLA